MIANINRLRWHGHYSSQYASGMSGPIVIYGPHTSQYDVCIPARICAMSSEMVLIQTRSISDLSS